MASLAKLKEQILNDIRKKYLGTPDIEKVDSVDFCTYFAMHYGDDAGRARLKEMFLKLERDLSSQGWAPAAQVTHSIEPNPDDIPEFWAAPWQFGLTADHSIKGASKLVHIVDIVDGFLKRPYNSKTEPLQVVFGPRSKVHDAVEDWSMVLVVGMGKASACRMILESVCTLNLSLAELMLLGPTVKALLRMRCTYDPAETEELQLQRAMALKNQVTERPRPDPLMWAMRWSKVIMKQGLVFASVIDDRIKAFNADRSEGFGIMPHEIAFIKAYTHQSQEFVDLLATHWQNFKVNESAVPSKRLAFMDLSPDTKVSRAEKKGGLWSKVLAWSKEASTVWLMREIGIFTQNIKQAQRQGKKINLRSNAKQYRAKADNHLSSLYKNIISILKPSNESSMTGTLKLC